MKKVISFCLVLVCSFCFSLPLSFAGVKKSKLKGAIVYFDLQRIFKDFSGAEIATNKFKQSVEEKQKAIQIKQEEIKKMREDYDNKSVVLSEEEKEKKSEEIEKKIKEVKEFINESNMEIKEQENKLIGSILRNVKDIITKIGQENACSLILNKETIIYASEDLDITDMVLEKLNASIEENKKETSVDDNK